MELFYKTKDGKMELIDNAVHIEIKGVEDGTIKDGTWAFSTEGGTDGRADL